MRVLVVDPYSIRPFRVTKDTNGGFGAAADYGAGLVPRLLSRLVRYNLDWPPMCAMYAAGAIRAQGHSVAYSRTLPEPADEYDLALVTSSIVCHETELETVRSLAARKLPVGVIGPFASSVPEPYVEAGAFVVSGEPEMYFHGRELTPAVLRTTQGIVRPERSVPLDELSYPAWDILKDSMLPRFRLLDRSGTTIPMLATRGCPYSCHHYCTYPLQQGRKVRSRSPESIVAEMAHWQDTLGASSFVFRDPVFSIDRRHTLALCDALAKSGRSFRFAVETHTAIMDEDLAGSLYKVGLRLAYLGIESVDDGILKNIHRYTDTQDRQAAIVRTLERMGIAVKAMYILALPGDTAETFRKLLDYAIRLRSTYAQFSVFTPYPGTPAFGDFKDRVTVDRYEDFTEFDLVFEHDNFTAKQVREMLGRAYHEYYTSLPWLAKYFRFRLASLVSS